jgi:hypothetical protein
MSAFDTIDFTGKEGAAIRERLLHRLSELRSRLEDPGLSDRETQVTRGAIQEIKGLLREPVPVVNAPRYSGPVRQFNAA